MIFRRRRDDPSGDEPEPTLSPIEEAAAERPHGPWDRAETNADEDDEQYLDLGGLVVKGAEGLELRMQVDPQSQQVAAVLLAGPESGLELRAFAAPKTAGIWDDVRRGIAAEAARHGGTATERDGEYGTELLLVVPVTGPDGSSAVQSSRIVGVEGPRWLLRGTFLGVSAERPDPDGVVERAFRDVIVVRGDEPMSPREMIPLELPANIQFTSDPDEPVDG